LYAATGTIVAYTDSDCFANPDWLTHLVHQLERSGAGAVGGPNLTPEDGWLAACVAAAPGQPMHVLESDQVSEHIPGCNMAFRREVLLGIGGFDPQFRKAGDDVDVCWRVQASGHWITFAPAAFVWHHRRQGPRSYLRQQAGYGQSEALLRFKHPDKFNGRGDGKWRGVMYGASLQGLRLGKTSIHRGTFAAGLFQCLYQPEPAHWAMLPGTLEWHVLAAVIALFAVFWPPAWIGAAGLLALSILVAGLQACQARLRPQYDGITSRLIVMGLCYAQPLVRSWHRYYTRIFGYRTPAAPEGSPRASVPLFGGRTLAYWSELGHDRTELLARLISRLDEHRWSRVLDAGWSDWDIGIRCALGTMVQICTVEEEHGGGKRLLRVRYRLRQSPNAAAIAVASLSAALIAGILQAWPQFLIAIIPLAACLAVRFRGARRAAKIVSLVDQLAEEEMQLVGCEGSPLRR